MNVTTEIITVSTEYADETLSDITGEPMGEYGWVLVRRCDGAEVAHFDYLSDITDYGDVIEAAAHAGAKFADEREHDEVCGGFSCCEGGPET